MSAGRREKRSPGRRPPSAEQPTRDLVPEALEALDELEWASVESTNVAALAFVEQDRHHLREGIEPGSVRVGWMLVQFESGATYAYARVPDVLVRAVRDAASPGRALRDLVQARYEALKLPE